MRFVSTTKKIDFCCVEHSQKIDFSDAINTVSMEYSSVTIRAMLVEAKKANDHIDIRKEIDSIKSAMFTYLEKSINSKMLPTKFKIEHPVGVFTDKASGRQKFIDALEHVRQDIFPEGYPYDMRWELVQVRTIRYDQLATEVLVYEIEFIDRPPTEEGAALVSH